jgi:hypothetical protein
MIRDRILIYTMDFLEFLFNGFQAIFANHEKCSQLTLIYKCVKLSILAITV